ncbi:TPA: acetolactate decarboxylase [Escherichia coli]|nr:acetolactate decarboxylase [Escherichia coli]
MSKIFQFSTISALMSGFESGDFELDTCNNDKLFGIGCSCGVSGELTIVNGKAWEATAKEPVHMLYRDNVPFVQVTDFVMDDSFECCDVDEKNMALILHDKINAKNSFVAVNVHANFETIKIRRPQRRVGEEYESMLEVSDSQEIDCLANISGQLIGFWTPEVYGRISVPGFHFHFLSNDEINSGHVLSYHANKAVIYYQIKDSIEIKNPSSDEYRSMNIDLNNIDALIKKVEN